MTTRTVEAKLPLQRAADRLRIADPEGWTKFLDCLDAYGDGAVEAILAAPTAELSQAQGRARGVREIANTLRGATQMLRNMDDAAKRKQAL